MRKSIPIPRRICRNRIQNTESFGGTFILIAFQRKTLQRDNKKNQTAIVWFFGSRWCRLVIDGCRAMVMASDVADVLAMPVNVPMHMADVARGRDGIWSGGGLYRVNRGFRGGPG